MNTKNRIQKGLIVSMKEIPLYLLKDKDVIAKSEISSSSFYKYYSDKNEVLHDIETELLAQFQSALDQDVQEWSHLNHAPSKKDITLFVDKSINQILNFFSEKKNTLAVLTSENGDPAFTYKIIEMMAKVVEKLLTHYFQLYGQEEVLRQKHFKLVMLSKRYSLSFVGPLLFWLENSDEIAIKDAKKLMTSMILKSPYDLSTHGF